VDCKKTIQSNLSGFGCKAYKAILVFLFSLLFSNSWINLDSATASEVAVRLVGIERDEIINHQKYFQVEAVVPNSLVVDQISVSMPQGSRGNQEWRLHCLDRTLMIDKLGDSNRVRIDCRLLIWYLPNDIQTLDLKAVLYTRNSSGGRDPISYESEVFSVKVGKLGVPFFTIWESELKSKNLRDTWSPPANLEISGRAFFNTGQTEIIANGVVVRACIEQSCVESITDESGRYKAVIESSKASVQATLSARYLNEEVYVTSKLPLSSRDLRNSHVSSLYEELPEKPEKIAVTSLKAQLRVPSRVRWGDRILMQVSISGKGSAKCNLSFYYPSSANGFQYLDSGGTKPFEIRGGQTKTIVGYFSRDWKVRWYVTLGCIDSKSGANLRTREAFIVNY
jgi:hypothetical protein